MLKTTECPQSLYEAVVVAVVNVCRENLTYKDIIQFDGSLSFVVDNREVDNHLFQYSSLVSFKIYLP